MGKGWDDCFFAQRNICWFGFCHRNHLDWLHLDPRNSRCFFVHSCHRLWSFMFNELFSHFSLGKDSDAFNDNSALPQLLPQFASHFSLISLIVFLIMSFITFTLFRSEDFLVLLAASLGCGVISLISFFENRVSNQLIRVLADVAVLAPALLIIIFLK